MVKKKTRIIIIIAVTVILLILFVPARIHIRDGGSIRYQALVYSVTRYNRYCEALGEDGLPTSFWLNGWGIEILGFTLYDDSERLWEEHNKHVIEMCEYYGFT